MADSHHPDDLARLRAEYNARFAAQDAEIARLKRRRRLPRRLLPLGLAALLVTLVPLATLAANPIFTDLDTAADVHRNNIQALGDAGITTGYDDPNTDDPAYRIYDPQGAVTREQMASFLARTAGLGGNPPVVNALTATNATNATNAQSATNASNANTVGRYAPSGLVRVARGTGSPGERPRA